MKLSAMIPPRFAKATAKEHCRYAVNGIEVRGAPDANVYLSATDGRVLAVRMVEGFTDEPVVVPSSLLLPARKQPDMITATNGELIRTRGATTTTAEPIDATFPPCHDVVPAVIDPKQYDRAVSLSVALLHKLATAICDDEDLAVTLILPAKATKPIAVLPVDVPDALGVLMPRTGPDLAKASYSYDKTRVSYCTACTEGGAA